MGQGLDVLTTCGVCGQTQSHSKHGRNNIRPSEEQYNYDDNALCGCTVLEDGLTHAVSNVNRGGACISEKMLGNHELLQHARQGNVQGVNAALEKGAWTETRRPMVMKPQKPECNNSNGGQDAGGSVPKVGMTALMFSAQAGSTECVRRLICARAKVNAVEEDGWSALHFSAKEGHFEVCMALLQSRANPELNNSEDRTPLQVAEEEHDNFADKLREALLKKN